MLTSSESSFGGVVIHVTGAFDREAERQLGVMLALAEPDSCVVIDFGRATFPDFAMAMLAEDLQGAVGTVALVGLGEHQRRILSYFGVDRPETWSAAKSDQDERPTRLH
jgi:hypothetical protein